MNQTIEKILKQLYDGTGKKHDAYYDEGLGVNFVPEGMPEAHSILRVPEQTLRILKETGQELNIQF
jgi:hypothetical protein